jgi:hypothetical protein
VTEYIRALHPNPEQPDYNDAINNEKLPGCGDTVLVETDELPPVKEGDVFRDRCPSCRRHKSRLEVVEIVSEE